MAQKQTMPLFYYRSVRQIYVWKTWWSFAVKGFLLTMITIQHQRMSQYRVRILLVQVIGGERVLFPPGKLATFKIILLLSEIIHMMPSFVCHLFSCSWLCSQRTILRKSSFPRPTSIWVCQWISKSIYIGLVVGYTWHAGLELRFVSTGGPQQQNWWLNVLPLDSIVSCLATGLILFSVLFVLLIERCHMRMASYKCANWRKLGTRIWLNSFCHHGSKCGMR